MIPQFYTPQPHWPMVIENVVELLGRISAAEELSGKTPQLRRQSRISAVQSTTAIEGSQLHVTDVERLAAGETIYGPASDIQDTLNAITAYDQLDTFDPHSVPDFLEAHATLTRGTVPESGIFRTKDVAIVGSNDQIIHQGSRPEKVPRLIDELFQWAENSGDHPLVISSAVHFLIEHIHPFQDGNGRIGRLWQTLILSKWRPIFAWMPIETLIHADQLGYYQALQNSREPEIEAAHFIDFMLNTVERSLVRYAENAIEAARRKTDR